MIFLFNAWFNYWIYKERMELSLANNTSTDETNRSPVATPVNLDFPVNAPRVGIDSSPSLQAEQEPSIIPSTDELSTFTNDKDEPRAILRVPSDYTQSKLIN